MSLTDYHAEYFTFELTKKVASDSIEKQAPIWCNIGFIVSLGQITGT